MVAPFIILGGVAVVSMLLASSSKDASAAPKYSTPAPAVPSTAPGMSQELQSLMANAIRGLGVRNDGTVPGPVTADQVRAATQAAGRLSDAGFPEAADTLRGFAVKASALVPPPEPEETVPLPQELSPEMQERVQRMIQNEREPSKLEALVASLQALPESATRDMAIATIKALILQIEQANIARDALEQADAVMTAPEGAVEEAVETQPPEPTPAPAPPQKSPVLIKGEAMARHLKSVQNRYGLPNAKGKEDMSIVSAFQSMAGLTADGKAGPGTIAKAASLGVGELPLVQWWPAGSSRAYVQKYRDTIRRLADETEAQGFPAIANQMRMAASYERGQGGIADYGPALV